MLECNSNRLNLEVGRVIRPEQKKNKKVVVTREQGGHPTLTNKVDGLVGVFKTFLSSKSFLPSERMDKMRSLFSV